MWKQTESVTHGGQRGESLCHCRPLPFLTTSKGRLVIDWLANGVGECACACLLAISLTTKRCWPKSTSKRTCTLSHPLRYFIKSQVRPCMRLTNLVHISTDVCDIYGQTFWCGYQVQRIFTSVARAHSGSDYFAHNVKAIGIPNSGPSFARAVQ